MAKYKKFKVKVILHTYKKIRKHKIMENIMFLKKKTKDWINKPKCFSNIFYLKAFSPMI